MKDLKHDISLSKNANCKSESPGLNASVIINIEIRWRNVFV